MSQLRQVILGILAALLSAAIILGSMSLALTEGSRNAAIAQASRLPSVSPSPSSTAPSAIQTPEAITAIPSPTEPPKPTPTSICQVPSGWRPVIIQAGDTMDSLGQVYGAAAGELAVANCLPRDFQIPASLIGTTLYVPPPTPISVSPTDTPTVEASPTEEQAPPPTQIPCAGPPRGWVKNYYVKKGDTLTRIAGLFDTTVSQLQIANCLGNIAHIEVGWILWVPNLPIRTEAPTKTPAQLPSLTPSLPSGNTSTPTNIPFPTHTFTPAPSLTPFPTVTPIEPTVPPPPTNTPVPPTNALPPPDTPAPTPTGTGQSASPPFLDAGA